MEGLLPHPPEDKPMLFDFAHVLLVVSFVLIWAMIGQFTCLRNIPTAPDMIPRLAASKRNSDVP